jgi:tetratricopeptide (TPR) repeat protein
MPLRPLSPAPSERSTRWLAGLGLTLAVILAYSGTLQSPFVYDDTLAIQENPTIRRLWPLSDVLWPQDEGGLTVSGRPVLNLSFAVNHAISGTNVWSYHVFNVLVHAGCALLLFGIVRRTVGHCSERPLTRRLDDRVLPSQPPGEPAAAQSDGDNGQSLLLGFAIAALWALHPLQTQAVTYTVQRAESLMGFFYLLTLYTFLRGAACHWLNDKHARSRRRRWWGLSVSACLLGMGTKEVMATAPLIVLLHDRTFLAGSFRAAWRERRGYYFGLAATWLVLAGLVLSTGGNRGGTVGLGTGIPLWAYPMTQFEALARYLMLAVWPHPLVFEYGTLWVKHVAEAAPHALPVLLLLGATIVALRRWPVPGFLGTWFCLILAPTALAPGTIQMIVEHRMYLPLAAVIAVAVLAAHRWFGRSAFAVTAAVMPALGTVTYQRNDDYRSPAALWSDTVAKRPENPRAHDGLAEAYLAQERLDEALQHRREAVRLLPGEARYHYNLALTLAAAQQRDEAVREYQRSLQLAPNEPRTHNNLAILFGELGNDSAALAHYAEAVRLKPGEALYHYNHGVALLRGGRYADAVASFEAALRLRADYADARFNLGSACVRLNQLEKAFAHYAEAVRLKPEDGEYRRTLGGALLLVKRPREALVEFRRALALQPDSVEARFGIGNSLSASGQTAEAVAQYESVLQIAPSHPGAHFKLGNALLDLDRVSLAVEHYTAALRLTPDDAEAHHNLGVAYARLERWSEARSAFESALRLKPDYADARRNLEQLRAVLGR